MPRGERVLRLHDADGVRDALGSEHMRNVHLSNSVGSADATPDVRAHGRRLLHHERGVSHG